MTSAAARIESFEWNGGRLIDEALGASDSRHIVLLHGWGGSRESLRGIGTLFLHTHRVHLIDLPGFGEAPPPPGEWGTIDYTDLVQNYILQRMSGTVLLVGHSFGGRVSVRLAARHIPAVKALVLMGVPGLPQPTWSRVRLRRTAIRWLRKALVALKPLLGNRPVEWHTQRYASKDYRDAGPLRTVFVRVVNEDLTESARNVACPTLLIWGTDDTETPVWTARRYQELMDGRARLELLPHKDHHLYVGTGAHLCGYKIRDWSETYVDA